VGDNIEMNQGDLEALSKTFAGYLAEVGDVKQGWAPSEVSKVKSPSDMAGQKWDSIPIDWVAVKAGGSTDGKSFADLVVKDRAALSKELGTLEAKFDSVAKNIKTLKDKAFDAENDNTSNANAGDSSNGQ